MDVGASFTPTGANFHGSPVIAIAMDPGNSQHLLFASQVGYSDGFVARFDPSGALLASTYFGGAGEDEIYSVAVDGAGRIAVAGQTYSYDLPVTSAAQTQRASASFPDAFVALFADFATYLGGSLSDVANTIAFDPSGRLLVGASTNSKDFPSTTGPTPTTNTGFFWLAAPADPAPLSSSRSFGCPAERLHQRR